MKNEIIIFFDKNKELLTEQANLYHLQYAKAITKLIKDEKFDEFILPLINLIHQMIENYLKHWLLNYDWDTTTASEMKIDKEHNLKNLINNKLWSSKKIENIEYYKINFNQLKQLVSYFSDILGENNTFINSRYSMLKNKTDVSISNIKIDKNEFEKSVLNLFKYITNINTVVAAYNISRVLKCESNKNKISYEVEMRKFLEKYSLKDKHLMTDLLTSMKNDVM